MVSEKQLTFISYSRSNKEFALKLARELKSAGFTIWLDQLDIPTGSRWDDEIEKALQRCSIFMVILTSASISSDNVKDEIGYAIDNQKRILPVLLEHATIPFRLRRFQYVDFTTKSYDEGIESAKQLLRNLINSPTTYPGSEDQQILSEGKDEYREEAIPRVRTPEKRDEPRKPASESRSSLLLVSGIIGVLLLAICAVALLASRWFSGGFGQGSPPVTPSHTLSSEATKPPVPTAISTTAENIVPATDTAVVIPTDTIPVVPTATDIPTLPPPTRVIATRIIIVPTATVIPAKFDRDRPAVWGWAGSDLVKKVTDMTNAGYRLDELNGFVDGNEIFNAIWVKTDQDRPAVWGWARADFDKKAADMGKAGYRLKEINAVFANRQELFNAIWVNTNEDRPAVWGWDGGDLAKKNSEMTNAGYRLDELNGFVDGKELFNAIWIKSNEDRPAVWGWARADFDKKAADMGRAGYRLEEINAFVINGEERFNAVWVQTDQDRPALWGWARADFDKKATEMGKAGYALLEINAYVLNGQQLFNAIWAK